MYIVDGCYKIAEKDSWENGIIGDCQDTHIDLIFKAHTLGALLADLKEFAGHDDVLLNSCGDIGRIDIQGLEDEEGIVPSKKEMALWKEGKFTLYAVIYTFYVYKAELVDLLNNS